jgi:plastocyanin
VPIPTLPMRLATAIAAAAVAVSLAGCSSSSAPAESASAAASTAPAVASEAPMESPAAEAATDDAAAGDEATGTAVLVDGVAPAERTITISADGLTPAALTIAVGDTVTFTAGDDATYAVEVGDLDSATVSGGLTETFQFPEAGEYPAVEIISGASAVITVQ